MVQDRQGRAFANYFEHMRVTTFAEKRISIYLASYPGPLIIIIINDYDIIGGKVEKINK